MAGLKLRDADRQKLSGKFICGSCSLLLTQPMQTECGHLFCHSCVQELLKKPSPECPVDKCKYKLQAGEVYPDNFTKREISELSVHCSNNDCKWVGKVKHLEEHLSVCGETILNCVHAQCDQNVKRSLLAQHLKEACLYRQVTCTHCKKEFAFNLLKDHQPDCSAFPVTCEHCKRPNIARNDVTKHELTECEEVAAECDYKRIGCDHPKVAKRKELHQHYKDRLILHVRLLLYIVSEILKKIQDLTLKMEPLAMLHTVLGKLKEVTTGLSNDVKRLAEKTSSVDKTVTGIVRRVGNLESGTHAVARDPNAGSDYKKLETKVASLETTSERNRILENELKEARSSIERLRVQITQLDEAMALTTVKLSDMEELSTSNNLSSNGTLLWKIENFDRRREDAMNGIQTAMYSHHFYSGQFGYKMCARIYLNGDGFGKSTHISLFFVVMKGEYDALLPWPFQKKITMMLMDQNNANHMIDAFRSDPQSSSFQKPTSRMNIASGSPLFMALDALSSRAYVMDNTMFVKIIVD